MRNVLAATSARACCRIRTLDLPAHSYNAQACLHPRWLELQLPSSGSTCTVAAIRFQSAMYQPCPCCASKSANRARIATDMSLPLLPRREAKQRLPRPTTVHAASGNRRRQPCLHSWPRRGTGAAGADRPHCGTPGWWLVLQGPLVPRHGRRAKPGPGMRLPRERAAQPRRDGGSDYARLLPENSPPCTTETSTYR